MKIVWGQKLGPETCPYIKRWVFKCKWFSIRLHHWFKSDDTRYPHDHSWDFISFVLWGSIIDRTSDGDKLRKWLSVNKFSSKHQHMVVVDKPAWTILFCGPEKRIWGYWVNGKFKKRNRYFYDHGHHDPCQ